MSRLSIHAERGDQVRQNGTRFRPMRQLVTLLLLAAVTGTTGRAQELNCSVSINTRALTGSDFSHLESLKQQMEGYLNERAWTDDTYQPEERIQCNLSVNFTAANTSGIDVFTAKLSVGSLRPIYGAPTPTTTFQYIDESWQFEYDRNQSLFYDPARYHPLASMLDFYANIILGYDYDSFSELGGTVYFERARKVAELANSMGAAGWNAVSDERSRAALVTQMLDPRMVEFRRSMYRYNLQGLDLFLANLQQARQHVLDALSAIKTIHEQMPVSLPIELFFSAKKQELTAIFEDSNFSSRAYGVLLEIDPQNAGTYDRLIQ